MHVKAKQMAVTGLLAAVNVIFMMLSTILESNSLFFIIAASYVVGIVIREFGFQVGATFWVASTFVNLIVIPNKLYCFTFAAMGLYLLLSEFLWKKIAEKQQMKHRNGVLWIGKYVIFNCMYLPAIIMLQEVLFAVKVSWKFLLIIIVLGQAALFVYDKVYLYFQGAVWGKFREKIGLEGRR